MKHTIAFFIVFCLVSSVLGADDPEVPEGVHYQRASEEVNEKAKVKIRALFSADATNEQVLSGFENQALICGPGLWRAIKGDAGLAKLGEGKVKFVVPILGDGGKVVRSNEMRGQLFQSGDEVLAFWKAFAKHADFADLKVRKLTAAELKLFWAMISFDITEPVFVVEGAKQRVLVAFTSPEKLKVSWIDDLAD